jgi:hypothetical protein
MKFENLIKKSYVLLEQDIPAEPASPESMPTPDASGMGSKPEPEQDDTAKRMQEQIQKSQERVLDLIKKMVSYIKEAATDTEKTKLSQELQKFINDIDEASLKGADPTASLGEIEKVVMSDQGKEYYEPKIAGESFYQTWKMTK